MFQHYMQKGNLRRRKDKEKQRQQHEHHHRKIAENWARLLIKTSSSAKIDEVCSPDFFRKKTGGEAAADPGAKAEEIPPSLLSRSHLLH